MYYYRSTQVPNEIFDHHLPFLNQAQLKVLLVVIRQVLGWIDPKTKKRKRKDWISIPFFSKRTGLTHKSISIAIAELVYKELIIALDYNEKVLRHPKDRRGKKRIYYTYAPYFRSLKRKTMVDLLVNMFTYPPYTKQTPTKKKISNAETTQQLQKITDKQRFEQIENNTKRKNN
ncbi:hypothetical protein KCTC32516_00554 [Polaribacter huanghezhanensis]|uniref:hypothetical protein n=1 Tax=Polaribacter huanghezhanensis TaxID=1354726 RepID=UPI00264A2192|nr:hypothetical protein [Polaribacter huanghezhanensis]WKD85214.1 hypothetical protein KCTC32516_00554 [Polaribacter huanghezhanensis]